MTTSKTKNLAIQPENRPLGDTARKKTFSNRSGGWKTTMGLEAAPSPEIDDKWRPSANRIASTSNLTSPLPKESKHRLGNAE